MGACGIFIIILSYLFVCSSSVSNALCYPLAKAAGGVELTACIHYIYIYFRLRNVGSCFSTLSTLSLYFYELLIADASLASMHITTYDA